MKPQRILALVVALSLGTAVACKDEAPLEKRALAFVSQVTKILNDHADEPDKAAAEIKALTQRQAELLKELRHVERRQAEGGPGVTLTEGGEKALQAAVNELMKAAMTEKVMGHKELHEALKALFQ